MSIDSDDQDQNDLRAEAPSGHFARFAAALRNGMEIARYGGIAEREPSPFEVVVEGEHHRLRHYFADSADASIEGLGEPNQNSDKAHQAAPPAQNQSSRRKPFERPAVLLVPPLMMTAEVWDVAPNASAVSSLYDGGADPWVVDFGSPEQESGGLERTLTDHVLAVSEAIDSVHKATGQSVHLMGYSQGGMFAYQAAAFRRSEGIESLVTFGSGVDLHQGLPFNLPTEFVIESIERFGKIQKALIPEGIPSWATRIGFQLMDPIKTVQQQIDFVRRLYDREALQKRDGMRRFMGGEGWTAFPGPALADLLKQLVAQNRLLQGGLVIDHRTVTLADITCPILVFAGLSDSIAPPRTVRAIYAAAPEAACYQVNVSTGHFGLVVGSRAGEFTWPAVHEWLAWTQDQGALPESASRLVQRSKAPVADGPVDDLRAATSLAWDLGANVISGAAQRFSDRVGILGRLAQIVAPQLPRLSRLAEIRSGTQVSAGLSLRERAEETPEDTFFLFDGRAHSYEAADIRIDNIVRGLISCGVRHGQHVGLLMATRPSAVAAAVALSRLGAVTVFLRPDIPLEQQLKVAPIEKLLCDPEHAEEISAPVELEILVLGGGGDQRTLAPGLIDMERIDPELVDLPEWYSPNPGLAGELALILITGDGTHLNTSRVSNRRWATSAYGTASGCALTPRDTVYCRSPVHHATGILVCVGGALVSGARLAMASEFSPEIDPESFWHDIRRYGVNVVFYTGSLCRVLVNSPESRQERHHSIRLFAGSGMPTGLWRRLIKRFAPATVVEFFASTEGNAVLVNLTGEKVGSLGRPLPGAGELAIAAWDLDGSKLAELPSGFAGHCRPGEIGLLVERVDRERGELQGRPLRSVFEGGDAWLSTRDLVRVDEDGDYWLVDHVSHVIHSAKGSITTLRIENVLTGELDALDLAAVYGVRVPQLHHEIPVAAITLRPNAEFDPTALYRVVRKRLRAAERPLLIRVMTTLPMTAGHRTCKRSLQSPGVEFDHADEFIFWLSPNKDTYLPVSSEDISQHIKRLKELESAATKRMPSNK